MTDVFLRAVAGTYDEPPDLTTEWIEVDGRRIQTVTGDDYPLPLYAYPKGEALYLFGITVAADLSPEDVLAELP